ncbi:MAG: hypothetical protein AMXMBFR46_12440 [Acidimicrobiia bacterium]
MTGPVVSVIVPVFNGARFLGECVASLLAQDWPALDVVVVDDGSTDDSAAIAEGFPGVRVVRRAHEGLGATRNAGIDAAAGDLVGFCDSDDLWKPNKASVQAAYLDAHPEVDLALCRMETRFEAGVEQPAWMHRDQVYGDFDGVSATSALFRPAVFEALRYRTDMDNGTDFNLLVRARASGFVSVVLDEVLLVRRIHDRNMMHRLGPARAEMFQTVREHLRSHR